MANARAHLLVGILDMTLARALDRVMIDEVTLPRARDVFGVLGATFARARLVFLMHEVEQARLVFFDHFAHGTLFVLRRRVLLVTFRSLRPCLALLAFFPLAFPRALSFRLGLMFRELHVCHLVALEHVHVLAHVSKRVCEWRANPTESLRRFLSRIFSGALRAVSRGRSRFSRRHFRPLGALVCVAEHVGEVEKLLGELGAPHALDGLVGWEQGRGYGLPFPLELDAFLDLRHLLLCCRARARVEQRWKGSRRSEVLHVVAEAGAGWRRHSIHRCGLVGHRGVIVERLNERPLHHAILLHFGLCDHRRHKDGAVLSAQLLERRPQLLELDAFGLEVERCDGKCKSILAQILERGQVVHLTKQSLEQPVAHMQA